MRCSGSFSRKAASAASRAASTSSHVAGSSWRRACRPRARRLLLLEDFPVFGHAWRTYAVAIATFSLGQVHGVVGGPQQRIRIDAVPRIETHTDADGRSHPVADQAEGLGQKVLDLQGHRVGLFDLVSRFQEDHELVAAHPGDRVARTYALCDPVGDGT